jgi:molybdopterin synthase catalytic subunit
MSLQNHMGNNSHKQVIKPNDCPQITSLDYLHHPSRAERKLSLWCYQVQHALQHLSAISGTILIHVLESLCTGQTCIVCVCHTQSDLYEPEVIYCSIMI